MARPPLSSVIDDARLRRALGLGVAALTLIVFAPAVRNGFVDWDDTTLLINNDAWRGLGGAQIAWAFTTMLGGLYMPVSWLSYGLDYVVWGLNPAGYHVTSIVLHAANAALFYLLALRLIGAASHFRTGALHVAAVASALFFAIHPLRAESVAWVTERRELLSVFFTLLSVLLYLRARESRRQLPLYAASLAWYLVALLSKSLVVTLPVLLVLLDFYPFRQLSSNWRTWWAPAARTRWLEKAPYFALSLIAGVVTYRALAAGALTSVGEMIWGRRLAVMAGSAWFYLAHTAVPFGLSPVYEMTAPVDWRAAGALGPAIAVVAITVALVMLRRRWPAGLAVWIAYLVVLVPVSGIAHSASAIGEWIHHDRWSYVSCLGIALLAGAMFGWLVTLAGTSHVRREFIRAAIAGGSIWMLGLAVLTWFQVQSWRDTETLWQQALVSHPECSICDVNLGSIALHDGRPALAAARFERAVTLRPDRFLGRANLGVALVMIGDFRRAIPHLQWVLERRPDDVGALTNLGTALVETGETARGLAALRRAERLGPDDGYVLTALGRGLLRAGTVAEALPVLRRAAELRPRAIEPRHALFVAYLAIGARDAAQAERLELATLAPTLAESLRPTLVTR